MSGNYVKVIAFAEDKIKISVDDLGEFIETSREDRVNICSYFQITNNNGVKLIAIIENYSIEVNGIGKQKYVIEAIPLALMENGLLIKGDNSIKTPLNIATITTQDNLKCIYGI